MRVLNALGFPCAVKNPNSIYLGLMGGVGDLVLASPTIKALKNKYPGAKLTLGTQPGIFYDIIANHPNIDKFDTSFFKWPPTKNIRKLFFNKKDLLIKKIKYDLVYFLDGILYENPELENVLHMNDLFSKYCNVTIKDKQPTVYLNSEDILLAKEALKKCGIEEHEKFITIGPQTRSMKNVRQWPYDKFQQLIKRIKERWNFKILICGNPNSLEEYPGAIVIRDKQPIRETAFIISKSSLYIGCDSGLTHVAGAFDIPIISINIGLSPITFGVMSPRATIISPSRFNWKARKNTSFHIQDEIHVDRVFEEVEKIKFKV